MVDCQRLFGHGRLQKTPNICGYRYKSLIIFWATIFVDQIFLSWVVKLCKTGCLVQKTIFVGTGSIWQLWASKSLFYRFQEHKNICYPQIFNYFGKQWISNNSCQILLRTKTPKNYSQIWKLYHISTVVNKYNFSTFKTEKNCWQRLLRKSSVLQRPTKYVTRFWT